MAYFKVNFFLDTDPKRKNQRGEYPIRIRSRFNNDGRYIIKSTGEFSTPANWNKDKAKPKKDVFLKNRLDEIERQLQAIYKGLREQKPSVNLNEVWAEFKGDAVGSAVPKSDRITDWIDFYLNSSSASEAYTRGVYIVRAHLTGKDKNDRPIMNANGEKYKSFNPNLRFGDLTHTVLNTFVKHLLDNDKKTGTIVKSLKFLKLLGKVAKDSNAVVNESLFSFKPAFKKINSTTLLRLSFEEIMAIRAYNPESKIASLVKDLWLLEAFTGLRWSDIINLDNSDIHADYIQIHQSKTGGEVLPTLNKYSREIIKKYHTPGVGKLFTIDFKKRKSKTGLPLTQQFVNRTIKEIAKQAGLTDPIVIRSYYGSRSEEETVEKWTQVMTHTGRRSFARILYQLGITEDIIREELGHGAKSITGHYIGTPEHRARIATVQAAWEEAPTKLGYVSDVELEDALS